MTGYKRQISYLDHLADGEKTGNAGFVKAEENDGRIRLEVRVKNLPDTVSGEFPLCEEGGGQLGRISISRGAGSCCLVWEETAEKEKGIRVESGGLFIRLSGSRILKAAWKEPVRVVVQKTEAGQEAFQKRDTGREDGQAASPTAAVEYPELEWRDAETLFGPEMQINSAESEPRAEPERSGEADSVRISREQIGKAESIRTSQETGHEPEASAVPCTERFARQEQPGRQDVSTVPVPPAESACRSDKWEQLCTMYPVIHPFEDGREYLSVAPKDFVVLRQEYQKMVHNSFLLHGYYNYRHLILGRLKEGSGWQYYLGVPGNFYHREKMVAEMFGFEAFEGEKDSAAPGDFGYFMKRVEI